MDVLNEILTFAPVWDPKIELQRNQKALQIKAGKHLSKMFPTGTPFAGVLGTQNGTIKKAVIFINLHDQRKGFRFSATEKPANRHIHPTILKKNRRFV